MKIFSYHYAYIIDYSHVKVNRIMKIFMQKRRVKMLFEKIKKLCEKRKISIYKLEKDLGFSESSICKWKTSKPSVEKIKAVADYFGVSIEYFLK